MLQAKQLEQALYQLEAADAAEAVVANMSVEEATAQHAKAEEEAERHAVEVARIVAAGKDPSSVPAVMPSVVSQGHRVMKAMLQKRL